MKKMYTLFIIICMVCSLLIAKEPEQGEKEMKISLRVIPHEGFFFLCRGMNESKRPIVLHRVVKPFTNANSINTYRLDEVSSRMRGLAVLRSYDPNRLPPSLQIECSKMYVLRIGDYYFNEFDTSRGHYIQMNWFFGGFSSEHIYVGFPDEKGEIAQPVVDLPLGHPTQKDQIALAFIFNKDKPRELGFLVMNKMNHSFTAAEPLSEQSRIRVTSPVINYSREIHVKGKDIVTKEVPSGEVAEWRIAWSEVLELIPAEDQRILIEAGGDLDLVWRTGGEESPPLPMNIAPPERFKDSELIPHPEKENIMILSDPQGE